MIYKKCPFGSNTSFHASLSFVFLYLKSAVEVNSGSSSPMEKSTTFLIRRSIYTFLQYYHYFTATAAILALPYSLSVLVLQFFVPSSPLLPSIHNHLKAIFMAAEFLPSPDFFRVLSFKISKTISSLMFDFPFTLSFFLVAKASIIHFLNHHHTPTSPTLLSSVLSLYKPLLSTFICNFFVLLSANSTAFCLLFFGFHLFNGFGFSSSSNWLLFMSAAGAVLYSVILANALTICNLALLSSGMEKSGACSAILRACVLIKGRASTALALAVPWNLALAAIEALFHYRVVRAYHSGDFNSFSIALEVVLIAYLYSSFVVLDTVVSSMLFKSCKTDCLIDEEGRDCYRIVIVAEKDGKRDGNAYVKLTNIEQLP
ncbi:hypothetical protein J1N35_026907 [Gossypium stocksii]|uniref:Uncharacterized protein n=1 Tax=Gossypium stocksii TaxID=47602 RepID=A0A9D3V8S8_9ROSI|nr:hypothetical protein J1N35_026907 [Gossypium stocksii]